MWGRRTSYKNQWTNKREAAIVVIVIAIFLTLVLYHVTGTVAVETLRAWLTVTIMSVPAVVGAGYWLGTMQTRGYEKGVTEKQKRAEQPIIIQGYPQNDQLALPAVTHQEAVDVSTA